MMNSEGFTDYSLFELIDTAIGELEVRLSDAEWDGADVAQLEYLKLSLETLYEQRDSGQVLLPLF